MSDHAHLPDEHEPRSRHDQAGKQESTGFWRSRTGLTTIGFLAIGGFFLVTEHRAHLIPYLGYLPFLLIFACLPMHFLMHGGHGHHGGQTSADNDPPDDRQNRSEHHH